MARVPVKPIWWLAFFLVQAFYVVLGLAIVFWTINTWDEGRELDAIFGAAIGAYGFFVSWRLLRSWVRKNYKMLLREDASDDSLS